MVIKVLVFTPDVLTTTEGKRLKTNREETGLYRLLEGGGDSTHRARGYRYVTCDITRDSIVDDIDALRDAQPVDEFEVPKDSENVLLTPFQKLLIQTLEGLRSDVKSISNPQSQVEKVTTENFAFFENTVKRSLKFKLEETGDITAMNLALSSIELSVSVAAVYISKLRTYWSPLAVAKATWRSFLEFLDC